MREIVKDRRIVSELLNRGMSLESLIDLYLDFYLYKEAVIISYQGIENEKVLEQRAFCFFSLGDYSSAIELYSDLSERSNNQMALLQLAYSCYHSGQYELAAKHLSQHLDSILKDDNPGAEKRSSPDAAFLLLQLQRKDAPPLNYLSAVKNFLKLYTYYSKNEYLIYRTFYHLLCSPETASWILKKKISSKELMDPSVNITAGLNYLLYLLRIFNSSETALAAYNGGPSRVKRWLSRKSYDSIERFVEEFPYEETRNFIKKVIASYMIYKELYKQPEELPAIRN
ncbi:MAG: transglycosylase SLT domain-containing protein [Spirochaetota bacterium]